jgi:hypothetical protein
MKSNLFLLIAILFLKFGFAQGTYHPLVEEDKLWYVVETGFPDFVQTNICKCEGDTLIGNEIFKVVFISYDDTEEYWEKYGYIREDESQKVYFSFYNSNEPLNFDPQLIYDFNAEVGDSLTITPYLFFNGLTEIDIVITDIDSAFVAGSNRKRTWFDSNGYWIEGIGSNTGLAQVGLYSSGIACLGHDLQCVKKEGETIYPDGYTGSCWVVGINETNHDKTFFNIFPNPVTGSFIVESISHIQSELIFELFSSIGKLERREDLNNPQSTQISTIDLKSGIYFYLISDKNRVVQKGKIIIR